MKTWPFIISILVILAVLSSPVLAISKSDLISQYQTGGSSGSTTPTATPTPTPVGDPIVPIPTPTPAPPQVPTGSGAGTLLVTSNPLGAMVYLDGVYKGVTPEPFPSIFFGSSIRGAIRGAIREGNALTLNGISAGPHQLKVTMEGYLDYITHVTVNGGETVSVTANLVQIPSVWNSPSGTPTTRWTIPSKQELLGLEGIYTPGSSHYANDLPSKGKPNIYLYSDRDLTAQVRLAPEYAIMVSEPLYQPGRGWQAEIRNGSLNGKGDFLFYEALGSDYKWQKEEGYIIRAASREQDMAFMLGQYGFNEKETVEFIDYWANHLIEDVDFVFYPQETDAVNQDMPLYIRPKPDHVMRIWFCAEPLVTIPEPVNHPETIVREGFYVVEWGVIIDDEYWMNHSPASSEVVL